ncbi:MAG TPA: hypothetical protein VEI52_07145 [Terriglobales bacterium]|nr:hypothetical protein [Terriglobales bacterium]
MAGRLLRDFAEGTRIEPGSYSGGRRGTTASAIAPNFEPADQNGKAAVALNLTLQTIDEVALKLVILPQRRQAVDVTRRRMALVIVLSTLEMPKIELIP